MGGNVGLVRGKLTKIGENYFCQQLTVGRCKGEVNFPLFYLSEFTYYPQMPSHELYTKQTNKIVDN